MEADWGTTGMCPSWVFVGLYCCRWLMCEVGSLVSSVLYWSGILLPPTPSFTMMNISPMLATTLESLACSCFYRTFSAPVAQTIPLDIL